MAFLQDDYDYVEKPPEDFFCPVTSDLLREAYVTPCCRNHLSPAAVTALQGRPCPFCREPCLKNPVRNNHFESKVRKLKVYCPNKSLECEWVGELGDLDQHLSQNSVLAECQFVKVACPYSCGDNVQQSLLQAHMANDCLNRPFICQYCDHEATYISVINDHWPICVKCPVDCPMNSLGCQWAGERGDLNQHLNDGSVEGQCQFAAVSCPYSCGHAFKRCEIKEHNTNDCPNRPFTCDHCDYEATYIEVTREHWAVCEKYPLQCPNACGGDAIQRQHLEEHLHKECPLEVVQCEYSYASCDFQCQRQHMQAHVIERTEAHLLLVAKVVSQKSKEQEELQDKIRRQDTRIEELDSIVREQLKRNYQQQKQIVAIMTAVALNVSKPLVPVFIPPPIAVMTDFEEHKKLRDKWYSPPFYSHIGGYRLCFSVSANGWVVCKGIYISVYVYMMQGEYDDSLKWPFRGAITIRLLNQKSDEGHREATIKYDDATSDEYAGRVLGQERADAGWGYPQFMFHSDLNSKEREYLQNDCLKFQVQKIVVRST